MTRARARARAQAARQDPSHSSAVASSSSSSPPPAENVSASLAAAGTTTASTTSPHDARSARDLPGEEEWLSLAASWAELLCGREFGGGEGEGGIGGGSFDNRVSGGDSSSDEDSDMLLSPEVEEAFLEVMAGIATKPTAAAEEELATARGAEGVVGPSSDDNIEGGDGAYEYEEGKVRWERGELGGDDDEKGQQWRRQLQRQLQRQQQNDEEATAATGTTAPLTVFSDDTRGGRSFHRRRSDHNPRRHTHTAVDSDVRCRRLGQEVQSLRCDVATTAASVAECTLDAALARSEMVELRREVERWRASATRRAGTLRNRVRALERLEEEEIRAEGEAGAGWRRRRTRTEGRSSKQTSGEAEARRCSLSRMQCSLEEEIANTYRRRSAPLLPLTDPPPTEPPPKNLSAACEVGPCVPLFPAFVVTPLRMEELGAGDAATGSSSGSGSGSRLGCCLRQLAGRATPPPAPIPSPPVPSIDDSVSGDSSPSLRQHPRARAQVQPGRPLRGLLAHLSSVVLREDDRPPPRDGDGGPSEVGAAGEAPGIERATHPLPEEEEGGPEESGGVEVGSHDGRRRRSNDSAAAVRNCGHEGMDRVSSPGTGSSPSSDHATQSATAASDWEKRPRQGHRNRAHSHSLGRGRIMDRLARAERSTWDVGRDNGGSGHLGGNSSSMSVRSAPGGPMRVRAATVPFANEPAARIRRNRRSGKNMLASMGKLLSVELLRQREKKDNSCGGTTDRVVLPRGRPADRLGRRRSTSCDVAPPGDVDEDSIDNRDLFEAGDVSGSMSGSSLSLRSYSSAPDIRWDRARFRRSSGRLDMVEPPPELRHRHQSRRRSSQSLWASMGNLLSEELLEEGENEVEGGAGAGVGAVIGPGAVDAGLGGEDSQRPGLNARRSSRCILDDDDWLELVRFS